MPTFVSTALTSDKDPKTVQRCLEDVHVGSFALKAREGTGTVVSLAVHVEGIQEGDPRVRGMAEDAMRNLGSALQTTPQTHHWI